MLTNLETVQNRPPRLTNLWVDFVRTILLQDQQLVISVGIDNLNIVHTGKLALAMAFSRYSFPRLISYVHVHLPKKIMRKKYDYCR